MYRGGGQIERVQGNIVLGKKTRFGRSVREAKKSEDNSNGLEAAGPSTDARSTHSNKSSGEMPES